jgi:hypothetical protein
LFHHFLLFNLRIWLVAATQQIKVISDGTMEGSKLRLNLQICPLDVGTAALLFMGLIGTIC